MYKRYFRLFVSAIVALILAVNVVHACPAHAMPLYGSFTLNTDLYYQSIGGIPYCIGGTFNAFDTFYAGRITYFYTFEINGVVEQSGAGSGWGWINVQTVCFYAHAGDFAALGVTATDYYFVPPITVSELSDGFMP